MSRGVLIIATGHPNYIRMAFNLAFSIKFKSPDCNITIAHSEGLGQHLNDSHKQFIDQFVEVPKEYYTYQDKIEHPMVKTRMYDLSPYDQTLYLDADTIWFQERSIDNWFDQLQGQEVVFQCEHKWKMSEEWGCLWTSEKDKPNTGLSEIKKIYNIPEDTTIYEMQSSFMYFEKGDKAKAFYDTAKEIYIKRPFKFYTWANGIPDELVFNISTAINKIELKQFPYKPLFFFEYHNNRDRAHIFNNYYALSMAGNNLPPSVIDIYDTLVKYYYSKIQKVRFPYLWKNKKQFLPERSKA